MSMPRLRWWEKQAARLPVPVPAAAGSAVAGPEVAGSAVSGAAANGVPANRTVASGTGARGAGAGGTAAGGARGRENQAAGNGAQDAQQPARHASSGLPARPR